MAWKDRPGKVDLKILDREHPPPHIHVFGLGAHAKSAIGSGTLVKGHLPSGLRRIAEAYVKENRERLLEAWRQVEAEQARRGKGIEDARRERDDGEV
ncbi:MAG: DUF4160 domain-containing protein [Sulfobacillus sp.]